MPKPKPDNRQEKPRKSVVMSVLVNVALVYLGLLALLYFSQNGLIYYPDQRAPFSPAAYGVPEVSLVQYETPDGLELIGWYAPPPVAGGPVVVFFHGNAAHIGVRADKARAFIDRKFGVFMPEYRGYGGNPGTPGEDALYTDARGALKWLEAQGIGKNQVVLYGESIGSGVAVHMAAEYPAAALLLEAPFSSLVDVGQSKFWWVPVGLLLKDRYDNQSKIAAFNGPVMVVHGGKDRVVPQKFGVKLYKAATEPKNFLDVPLAGHNDVFYPGVADAMIAFLDKQGISAPSPEQLSSEP